MDGSHHIMQRWVYGISGWFPSGLGSACLTSGFSLSKWGSVGREISKIQTEVWTFYLYWFGSAQMSQMRAGSPFPSASCALGMGSVLWGHRQATDGMIKSQIWVWEWSCNVMGYHRHLSFIWFISSANYPNKSVLEWNLALTLHGKNWNTVGELTGKIQMQMSGNEWDLTKCNHNWEIQKQYEIFWEDGAPVLIFHLCAKSIFTINNICRWFLWAKRKGDTHCCPGVFLHFMKFAAIKPHGNHTEQRKQRQQWSSCGANWGKQVAGAGYCAEILLFFRNSAETFLYWMHASFSSPHFQTNSNLMTGSKKLHHLSTSSNYWNKNILVIASVAPADSIKQVKMWSRLCSNNSQVYTAAAFAGSLQLSCSTLRVCLFFFSQLLQSDRGGWKQVEGKDIPLKSSWRTVLKPCLC